MGTNERHGLSGPQLGSLIGAVAGALFIFINAGGTDHEGPVRLVGIALFIAAILWGVARAPESTPADLSGDAWRIYRISVIAEIVAIPLGASAINRVFDRPELTVLWVVAVVGVHFLPFSRVFGARLYVWLGASMILLAAVGAAVTLASGSDTAPSWFAVAAGVVLLAFSVAGPRIASATSDRP